MLEQNWEISQDILPGDEDAEAWIIAPEEPDADRREIARRRRRLVTIAAGMAWVAFLVVGALHTTIGRNGYPQIDTPGFLRERSAMVSMAQTLSANNADASTMVDVEQSVVSGRLDTYTATTRLETIADDLVTRGKALAATSPPTSLEAIYQLITAANQDLISTVTTYQSYLTTRSPDDAAKTESTWSQYNNEQTMAVQEMGQAGHDLNVPLSLPGSSNSQTNG